MLGYFEQLLNALVYELYFPDDLHAQNLRFFDLVEQASLPDLADIPEGARLDRLRQVFETLYDGNHPHPHRPGQAPDPRRRPHHRGQGVKITEDGLRPLKMRINATRGLP